MIKFKIDIITLKDKFKLIDLLKIKAINYLEISLSLNYNKIIYYNNII